MQPAATPAATEEVAQERTEEGQFLSLVAVLGGQSWLLHLICDSVTEN